jgi:hypothetical protein
MDHSSKTCSTCKKTRPIAEFYWQGDRYESRCKACKREARKQIAEPIQNFPVDVPAPPPAAWTYEDYGLTKDEFTVLVGFFEKLWKIKKEMK